MAIDLSKLSFQEMTELRTKLDTAIATRQKEEQNKAREKILEIAKSLGMSVQDLVGASPGKAQRAGNKESKPVAAKYQNPANDKELWTGRGRQPNWVKEYTSQDGKKIDDLLIK